MKRLAPFFVFFLVTPACDDEDPPLLADQAELADDSASDTAPEPLSYHHASLAQTLSIDDTVQAVDLEGDLLLVGDSYCGDECVFVFRRGESGFEAAGGTGETFGDELVLRVEIVDAKSSIVGTNHYLRALDTSAPSSPFLFDELMLGGELPDLVMANGFLLVANMNYHLQALTFDANASPAFFWKAELRINKANPRFATVDALGDKLFAASAEYDSIHRGSLAPNRFMVEEDNRQTQLSTPVHLRLSPDGETIFLASHEGLELYDQGLELLATWTDEAVNWVEALDAQRVFVGTASGVKLLDFSDRETPELLLSYPVEGGVHQLVLERAHHELAVVTRQDSPAVLLLQLD